MNNSKREEVEKHHFAKTTLPAGSKVYFRRLRFVKFFYKISEI
jgi:hypothetical protein